MFEHYPGLWGTTILKRFEDLQIGDVVSDLSGISIVIRPILMLNPVQTEIQICMISFSSAWTIDRVPKKDRYLVLENERISQFDFAPYSGDFWSRIWFGRPEFTRSLILTARHRLARLIQYIGFCADHDPSRIDARIAIHAVLAAGDFLDKRRCDSLHAYNLLVELGTTSNALAETLSQMDTLGTEDPQLIDTWRAARLCLVTSLALYEKMQNGR